MTVFEFLISKKERHEIARASRSAYYGGRLSADSSEEALVEYFNAQFAYDGSISFSDFENVYEAFEKIGDYEDRLLDADSPEARRNLKTYHTVRRALPRDYDDLETDEREAAFDAASARLFKKK